MLGDEEIVRIRTRGMQSQATRDDISGNEKMLARIINIAGMPIIVILAALIRWALVRRRRRRLAGMEVA